MMLRFGPARARAEVEVAVAVDFPESAEAGPVVDRAEAEEAQTSHFSQDSRLYREPVTAWSSEPVEPQEAREVAVHPELLARQAQRARLGE